jgi:hypothetical protein
MLDIFLFSFLSFYTLDIFTKNSGWRGYLTALPSPYPPLRRHMSWFLTEGSLSKKRADLTPLHVAAFGCSCSINVGTTTPAARSNFEGTVFRIVLLTHLRARHWEHVLKTLSQVSGYNIASNEVGTTGLALLKYVILNDWLR